MVDKRLKKGETMMAGAIEAELLGTDDYKTLVICWGSSYGPVREAIERLGIDDIAMLAVKQVNRDRRNDPMRLRGAAPARPRAACEVRKAPHRAGRGLDCARLRPPLPIRIRRVVR